jgi:hypothetical protein
MSQITDNDWELFNRGYEALKARDAAQRHALDTNDAQDVREATNASAVARKAWNEVHNLTADPKARAIAALFLKQDRPIAGYAKPLERWSGGSVNAPGKSRQVNRDYPDVFVGVFPSA